MPISNVLTHFPIGIPFCMGWVTKHLLFSLRSYLTARNFSHVKLNFPPSELCTDNAAMIAWTGIQMYEAGWESDLSVKALKKWSLDGSKDGGGILGVEGWRKRGDGVRNLGVE